MSSLWVVETVLVVFAIVTIPLYSLVIVAIAKKPREGGSSLWKQPFFKISAALGIADIVNLAWMYYAR